MCIVHFIFVTLLSTSNVQTVLLGLIPNTSLIAMPSNMTINGSTCDECKCKMFTLSNNVTILSFNCFTIDSTQVNCQFFTSEAYLATNSHFVAKNSNSTFFFQQLSPDSRLPPTVEMITTRSSDVISGTFCFLSAMSAVLLSCCSQLESEKRLHTDNILSDATLDQVHRTTPVAMSMVARSIVTIIGPDATVAGLFDTSAGGSTVGSNGRYSPSAEEPPMAFDNITATKYLNFGGTGGHDQTLIQPGVGSGFYVTPSVSNASVAIGLLFSTTNDLPNRDPLTVTLEGSNSDSLDSASSWTLIYTGPTGINATIDPGRQIHAPPQYFYNAVAYRSYRLLVTSQRGNDSSVQYAEAQIIGYV